MPYVRFLNSGVADLYSEIGDQTLWDALIRLWRNMIERKMYVTGGVGARYKGEAFGDDYELPNSRAYTETCAAIANFMWNWRMVLITGEARFADVMELALYNGVLLGISLDGKDYFYVNPLADRGAHRRKKWFDCACCPPNVARIFASLSGYFYSVSKGDVWAHLYAQSTARMEIDGKPVTLKQRTDYPWNGEVDISFDLGQATFGLCLRVPRWSQGAGVQVNGRELRAKAEPGQYVRISRSWSSGDSVRLSLPMPVEKLVSHPHVLENTDKIALKRGPLVYCIEQADNDGFDVWDMVLPPDAPLKVEWMPNLLNGIMLIQGEALATETKGFEQQLYRRTTEVSFKTHDVQFKAVPYYAWANREPGPMAVWIRSTVISH